MSFALHPNLEMKPFTEKQVELVATFGRLKPSSPSRMHAFWNELRQRTADLTESAGAADGHVGRAESHQLDVW